jgi:hypothetical protein
MAENSICLPLYMKKISILIVIFSDQSCSCLNASDGIHSVATFEA